MMTTGSLGNDLMVMPDPQVKNYPRKFLPYTSEWPRLGLGDA